MLATQALRDGIGRFEVGVGQRRAERQRGGQRDARGEQRAGASRPLGAPADAVGAMATSLHAIDRLVGRSPLSTGARQKRTRTARFPWCSTRSLSSSAS